MKICTFIVNLKIMILDYIFFILIKPFIGVLGLTSSLEHYSFALLDGKMVLCCIMIYTKKLEICWYVTTAFGIFEKQDHVGTNHVLQHLACSYVISGTDIFVLVCYKWNWYLRLQVCNLSWIIQILIFQCFKVFFFI